jgi:hypothetical protein
VRRVQLKTFQLVEILSEMSFFACAPGSGKDIAEGKGVHREAESEGSWIMEHTNQWATLWSDE